MAVLVICTVSDTISDYCNVAVSEHGQRFHEDIQFDLYDAPHWALVRVFAVLGSNAARISIEFMGRHQRITGNVYYIIISIILQNY